MLDGNMKICEMAESHIEKIAELERMSFSEPWSEKSLREQLDNPAAYFIVLEDGNETAGYGGMHVVAGEAYIDNVAVFPDKRGRGMGAEILRALTDEAIKRECDFISLEVRKSNPAVRLYERAGFHEAGRRKGFYAKPKEDALIMTKMLKNKGDL